MTEIVLSSNNKKKIAELETLFHSASSNAVKLLSLKEIGFTDDIEENGTSFEENSIIKASVPAKMGYIGIADELVIADAKFSNVLSSLLGRTLVFDTLDNASAMSKKVGNKVKVVTLDGQIINAGGSYTGGSVKKGSNILGRAGEIKRLESERAELDEKIAKLDKKLSSVDKEIESAEDISSSAQQKISLIKVMRDSENTRYEQLLAKLDANETLIG